MKNNIVGTTKAYGSVPAAYGTLLDLGTTYLYNTIMIVNGLDAGVTLMIGTNEVPFPANKNITIDNATVGGLIQYKYTSAAPTVGSLEFYAIGNN